MSQRLETCKIMILEQEDKAKDTYGSKLRNLLSPFDNIITTIYSNSREDHMSIPDDVLLKFLRENKKEFWESYKKMVEFSYTSHLDGTEYIEKEE